MEWAESVQNLILEYLCETEGTCLQIIRSKNKRDYFSLYLDPSITDLLSRSILCRAYAYQWNFLSFCNGGHKSDMSFTYLKEQMQWVKITQHTTGDPHDMKQDPLEYYSSLFSLLHSIHSSDLFDHYRLIGVENKFVHLPEHSSTHFT